MGGCNGRADALIGAVEAQKAEGVLHLHFFVFLQMVYQFHNLSEIADMFRKRLLTLDAVKAFHDRIRCAMYPDVAKFEEERGHIEKTWPAFAHEDDLCRAPPFVWEPLHCATPPPLHANSNMEEWLREGSSWAKKRQHRLQYVLSRMNHHIHPLVNATTGERRPLSSCQPKNKPRECKGGFPLLSEMTEHALLICPCIAREKEFSTSGTRSRLGCVLSKRNNPWVNAGPPAWAIFAGDNGDIKLPLRVPILPETHEVRLYDVQRSCGGVDKLDLAYQVQVGQAAVAGYFGYTAKMQDVGKKRA